MFSLWVLEVPGSNPGETQVKSFRNQSASFQSFSTRFLKSYMKTRLTLSFHKITDFTDLEVGIYGTGSRKPAISLLLLVLSCRDLYCWKGNWILHLFPSILARFGSYGDNEKANAFSLSRKEKVLTQHIFRQPASPITNVDWIVSQHSSNTHQLYKAANSRWGSNSLPPHNSPSTSNLKVRCANRFSSFNLNGQLLFIQKNTTRRIFLLFLLINNPIRTRPSYLKV